jgi:type II secretory pathway pseudopilin PulG
MKTALNIVFAVIIIILAYFLIESIMEPIRFNREKDRREKAIKERLIDIRTAQETYKAVKNRYTGSFDTLIFFLKNDSLPLVFKTGSLTDEMIADGITTEKEAVKKGLISRDTTYIPVRDSIFYKGYSLDSLRFVPTMKNTEFQMASSRVMTTSMVLVNVFEAYVLNDVFLKGLDRQLVVNYNDQRQKTTGFPGMKVGDIKVPNNNAGNWED